MKILLIDDDLSIRTLYEAVFKAQGHTIESFDSAMGAASALVRLEPDVVLVDVNMPGLQGDRVVKLLRQRAGFGKTKFILHSGGSLDELERLAVAAGADGAIPKQGSPLSVMLAVSEFLRSGS